MSSIVNTRGFGIVYCNGKLALAESSKYRSDVGVGYDCFGLVYNSSLFESKRCIDLGTSFEILVTMCLGSFARGFCGLSSNVVKRHIRLPIMRLNIRVRTIS